MNNNQQNYNNPQDIWQQQQMYQQQQWSQYGYYNQSYQYPTSYTQPPPPPPVQQTSASNSSVDPWGQQQQSNSSNQQNDRRNQQQNFSGYKAPPAWNSNNSINPNRSNWTRGGKNRGGGNSNRGGARSFNDSNRNDQYIDNSAASTSDPSDERFMQSREAPVPKEPYKQPSTSSMDAEDAAFDEHFKNWEREFEKWRNENKNHPDKEQYAKYENQFLEVRKKLLERRTDMIMRKRQQMSVPNPPKTIEQMKFESQWNAGDPQASTKQPPQSFADAKSSSNIITVQMPPSNTSFSDTAVAPLLFGSTSVPQDKDFKNDSFDADTFDSFNEDSSNSGLRERVFSKITSIPGLDVPPTDNHKDKTSEEDIIDLDNNDNASTPIAERKEFELILPDFKSKIDRNIMDIDNLLEEPGRSTRSNRNLVIIRGASGAGKSHLASLIQRKEFEFGNDRCQIVEARGRNFQAVHNEIMDIIREGYINFIIVVLTKASVQQMSIISGSAFKRGCFQSFSIEIHQKLEACMKNNVNRVPISEIREAIEDLVQNPTPLRTPILDATSLLSPKPKREEEPKSDNKPLDYASLTNLLKDQNVMDIVQKLSSSQPGPPQQKNINNYNTSQTSQQFVPNQRSFNNYQQDLNMEDPVNVSANAIEECPVFEAKKVIEYDHMHKPTFEEQLLEFKIFRTIDYKHQTKQELQDLRRSVDIDKIIEKRKAVAQRKKILEYLRNAERPEDTVSNPLYPKNWEVIPRDRPPRRNKRKKIKTTKIKRILTEKRINDKATRGSKRNVQDSDLEEISSDEDFMHKEKHSQPKIMKLNEGKENKVLAPLVEFKDEFANVSPKSIPDFNHFNHANFMDIREILWLPGRRNRAPKILILLRGVNGSGKSHLVQLIKRKETEMGKASDIRILSIDNYFLTDDDDDEKSSPSSKEIENYLEEMLRHLRKTITDGLHSFIIIDAENCDLTYYEKFYQLGCSMGFNVFTIELYQKVEVCLQQCCRNVTQEQISDAMKLLSKNRIPSNHTLLIPSALYAEYNCFMNPKLATSSQSQVSQVDDSRFNWHNRTTKDLCDLLEGQRRYQRPQLISLLLRGPDTHGKNQLASMIIAKEKEMRNNSVTYISIEDFFVSKSTGKFEFSSRLIDESIRNLTKQLRDIIRFKSFKFVIINVETGDFKHYTQVHELMSSYGYKCFAIELYRDANKCAENDPHKRSFDQFEAIIDEFKLNPTPDDHELLNAGRFYQQNAKNDELNDHIETSESTQIEQIEENASLNVQKVKKFDRNLRNFNGFQEEFFALLTRRVMVDGKFIAKNTCPPSKLPEFNWFNQEHIVDIRELWEEVQSRPQKIAIFIRGAPGSGKSFLARLIERKELESGYEDCVTVLTIDKYFEKVCYQEVAPMQYEKYNEINLDETKVGEYMEQLSHELENLINYGENDKSLVIVDGDFCDLSYYHRMWNIAVNEGGFVGYTIELNQDDEICLNFNDHRWSTTTLLKKNSQMREIQTPSEHTLLDPEYIYGEFKYEIDENGDIFTVDVNPKEISDESDSDDSKAKLTASKWDTTDFDKYERMDGTKNKTLHRVTMDEYLQMNEWTMRPSTSGKKRVRWADIEEQKAQERERKIGFIVGQTDWNRIMNDTDGKNALEKTKYIEPRRKK